MKQILLNAIKIFLCIFIHIKKIITEDIIYQEKPNSIVPFRNNEQAIGSYEFHLRISQAISYKPRFLIQFPTIYQDILKDPENCRAKIQLLTKAEETTIKCQINQQQILIPLESKWSYIDVGYLIIEIYDIINPSNVQEISSGEFYIQSWSGSDFLIDQNKGFGTLAFPLLYNTFNQITIQNDGSNIAGFKTNYLITFQPSIDYVPLSWFRIKFPSNFNYDDDLSCILINTQQKLNCYIEKEHIFIKGSLQQIKANETTQIKIIGIKNPYQAIQQTEDILFESLEPYLNTVIDYKDNINGFEIKAGQISEVYIEGFPLVQNLYVDYTIKFTPLNDIPSNGSVKITFPPTFQNLNNVCRVTTGLEPLENDQIKCVSDGLDIYITNFKDFKQSEITVKIFATNPPQGGPTDQFEIRTYSDQQQQNLIDIEENAGNVIISSIGKPDFTGFDFYQPHFNCTYLELCNIDFRYFPDPTRILPQSSDTNYSTMDFQIPHWWWINGTNDQPECLFEKNSAYQCWQREHIFSIQTPEDKGLDSCDYPISIDKSQLTPIPGQYPFRILTYLNGGKWNSELPMINNINEFIKPIEQDTYVMTIPFEPVYLMQIFSSSSNANDQSNLLHVKSTLFPFDISAEGSINLNFTHYENNYRDEAAWPFTLGTTVSNDSLKEHPCRVYLNDKPVGYNNGDQFYHKNVRCYINSSNTNDKYNTFIQIFGFDRNLIKNEKLEFYIPRVKFCETLNRLCKVTMSYTNTFEVRDEPYVLNQREQDLHRVNQEVNLSSNILGSVFRTNNNESNNDNEKCRQIDLTIRVNNLPQTLYAGDYVIFKRVYSDWHFIYPQNYQIITPSNESTIAHSILDHEYNIEYMVIKITQDINSGSNKDFVVKDIINTPYAFSKAQIWGTFYSKNQKILDGVFPLSVDSTDGGIERLSFGAEDYWGNREGRLAQDYWHPFLLKFRNCMEVPKVGEITYTFDQPLENYFKDFDRNCTVWLNIKNKMANETHPECQYDDTINGFRIRNFEGIAKRQELAIQIRGQLDQDISQFKYEVKTYNITNDINTLTDFSSSVHQSGPYNINRKLAPSFEFIDWKNLIRGVYKDQYGTFEVIIETGHDMYYEITESHYFEFIYGDGVNVSNNDIDCRYGEYPNGRMYPSVECTVSGNSIKMLLHFRQSIEANKKYIFSISTRRQNKQQGLRFTEVGIYTLSVYSYVNGVKQRSGRSRYEVWGPKIDHFFIHSTNKVKNDWTLLTLHSEFQNPRTINQSDPDNDNSYAMLVVFFETANNGFALDLGTGLPEFDEFPCDVRGLQNLKDRKNVECRLYYGYNDAPTKVEITKFKKTNNVRNLLVRTPLIKNPNKEAVPNVWFEIQQHTIANNNLDIQINYEGHYKHLNYTYTKHSNYEQYSNPLEEDNTQIIYSSQSKLNNTSTVQLPIITPVTLNENDTIAYKFPKYWPLVEQLQTKACYGVSTKDCYTIVNQKHEYFMLVTKLQGNANNGSYLKATLISPNAEVPLMTGAPQNIIESYIFHHTRLIKKYNLTNFNGVKGTADKITNAKVDCDIKNPMEQQQWDYTVTFSLPHYMIINSQLQIKAHDYIASIPYCSQTSNSKLVGQLNCSIVDNYAVITNFEPLDKDTLIEIKVNFQNPNYDSTNKVRDWTISSYFLESNGFYYLKGTTTIKHISTKCDIVPLGSQSLANTDINWDHMYHKTNSTRIDEIGPLNFYLQFPNDITIDNTRYVIVEISKDFEQVPGEFVAIWNNTQFSSKWDVTDLGNDLAYTIYLPKSGDFLQSDVHKLTLTTLNAQNNLNGFKYPSIPQQYQSNFEFYQGGVKIIQSYVDINVRAKSFTNFEAKFLQSNPTHKNILWIAFKSDITIPINSSLIITLPLQTKQHPFYKKLFDNDAGTTLSTNDQTSCYIKEPITLSVTLTCTIELGSQSNKQDFKIYIKNTSGSLPSNQKIIILIDGIKNPKYSSDLSHVNISLDFQINNISQRFDDTYAFTISKKFSTIYNNLTEPTMTSYQIGNTNIQADFNFKCTQQLVVYNSSNGLGYGDYLMLEFPEGYSISKDNNIEVKVLVGGAAYQKVDVGQYNNIIVWKPDVPLNANQSYTFQMRKFNQATYVPNDSSFKINCIKNFQIITENIYNQITQFTALALDQSLIQIKALNSNDDQMMRDCYQQFQLEIQLDSIIQKIEQNGKLEIYIPTQLLDIDMYCENDIDSDLLPIDNLAIQCQYDSVNGYYDVGNFQEILQNQFIRINFWAKTPSTNQTLTLTVKIFKDNLKVYKLAQFTKDMPIINETLSCFKMFQFKQHTNKSILTNVLINQPQQFEFYLTAPQSIQDIQLFNIQFNSNAIIPDHTQLVCFFDQYEAQCSIVNQSPIEIQIKAPLNLTLISLQQYLIKLEFRCGNNQQPGIKFTQSGTQQFTIDLNTYQITKEYTVSPQLLNSVKFQYLFSNTNNDNFFIFNIQSISNISSGDYIQIQLPIFDIDTQVQNFNIPNVEFNTDLTDFCISTNKAILKPNIGNNIICQVSIQQNFITILIKDFQSISANSSIDFTIGPLIIHSSATQNNTIDIKVSILNSTYNIQSEQILREIINVSTNTSTFVNKNLSVQRTKNALAETAGQYTFQSVNIDQNIDKYDYICFVFDSNFYFQTSLSNCNTTLNGSFQGYGRFIIFKPSSQINSGTYNFCINGITNPLVNTTSTIKVYVIYSHYFTKILQYNFDSMTQPVLIVNNFVSNNNNAQQYNIITFSIDPTVDMQLNEYFQIEFNTSEIFMELILLNSTKFEITHQINTINIININVINQYIYTTDGILNFELKVKNGIAQNITYTFKTSLNQTDNTSNSITLVTSNVNFDCFIESITFGTTSTLIISTTSNATNIDINLKNTSLTNPTNCLDDQSNTLTCTLTSPDIIISTVPSPLQFSLDINMSNKKGYQIQQIEINNQTCSGLHYIYSINTFQNFTFNTLHKYNSASSNALVTFWQFNGEFDIAFSINNIFMIDVFTLNEQNLKFGNLNDQIPCALLVNSTLQESTFCKVIQSNYSSTKIIISVDNTFKARDDFNLILYNIYNPEQVNEHVSIYLKHLDNINDQNILQISYTSYKTITNTAIINQSTITSPLAQSQQNINIQLDVSITQNDHLIYIMTGSKNCNKKISDINLAKTNNGNGTLQHELSSCLISTDNIVNNAISISNFEISTDSNSKYYIHALVTSKLDNSVQYIYQINYTEILPNTITQSITLNNNTNSDQYIYDISLQFITNGIYKSEIVITLPSAFITPSNYQVIYTNDSIVTGTVSLSYHSNQIYLKDFKYINKGTLQFQLKFYSILNTTLSFTNGSIILRHQQGQYNIAKVSNVQFENPSTNLSIKASAKLWMNSIRRNQSVKISQNGRLIFQIYPQENIITTDILYLITPSGFQDYSNQKLLCKIINEFDDQVYYSKLCYYDFTELKFVIKMPLNQTLEAGKIHTFEIYSIFDNIRGIQMPNISDSYEFTLEHRDSTSTLKNFSKALFKIGENNINYFCQKPYHVTNNERNSIILTLSPQQNLSTTHTINIYLSTQIIKNQILLESFYHLNDSVKNSGQQIECQLFQFSFDNTQSEILNFGTCQLYLGSNQNQKYLQVKINLLQTLSANTLYSLYINNLINPKSLNTLVNSYVEIKSGNNIIEFGQYDILFETQKISDLDTTYTEQFTKDLTTTEIQNKFTQSFSNPNYSNTLLKHIDGMYIIINNDLYSDTIQLSSDFLSVRDSQQIIYGILNSDINIFKKGFNIIDIYSMKESYLLNYTINIYFIKNRVKVYQLIYTGQFQSTSVLAQNLSLNLDNFQYNKNSYVDFTFENPKQIFENSLIEISLQNLDTFFDDTREQTILLGTNVIVDQITTQQQTIKGLNFVDINNTITLKLGIMSTQSTNQNVCVKVYNQSTNNIILDITCTILISTSTEFSFLYFTSEKRPIKVQSFEKAPITLNFLMMDDLIQHQDKLIISLNGQFQSLTSSDFLCTLNYYVSEFCQYISSTKKWEILAPRETSILKDQYVTLKIIPIRHDLFHVDTTLIQFPQYPSITQMILLVQKQSGQQIQNQTKIQYQVLPPRWHQNYLNTYIVQNDTLSNYKLNFKLARDLTNGRIIIELPTAYQYGRVYNDDFGTSYYHGEEFPCLKNINSQIDIKCYIFFGNGVLPGSLVIYPQGNALANQILDVTFPLLLNPVDDMTEVFIYIKGQSYNNTLLKWEDVIHYEDYLFVAKEILVTAENKPAPNWSPNNRVGEASTWNFTFTSNNELLTEAQGGFDKIVIFSERDELIFLNNNTDKILQCSGFNVVIYNQKNLIELAPKNQINIGDNVSLNFVNFLNQQYVITNGVPLYIDIWSGGYVAKRYRLQENIVQPNLLDKKIVEYKNNDMETGAFDTYSYTILPKNKIPLGGFAIIQMSDNFTNFSNCEIYGGIKAACKVEQNGSNMQIKLDLKESYDPKEHGDIKFKIDIQNPITPGTYDMDFISYYNTNEIQVGTNYAKIDEDNLISFTYTGVQPFVYFKKQPFSVWRRDTCPDNWDIGVFRFKVRFSETLTYEDKNHLIITNLQLTENQRFTSHHELLCYFDLDEDFHSVKSEYCQYENGQYKLSIPEEVDFSPTNDYIISIESRNKERGLKSTLQPPRNYVIIETDRSSISNEVAIIDMKIRGCYYDNLNVNVVNWNEDFDTTIEISGDMETLIHLNQKNNRYRFQVLFQTYNEMKNTQYLNLGYTNLVNRNDTQTMPCYLHTDIDGNNIQNIYRPQDPYCEFYKGHQHAEESPLVFTLNSGYESEMNSQFRFGLGPFKNYQVTYMDCLNNCLMTTDGNRNTFTDITIQAQYQLENGLWVSMEERTHYKAIRYIYNPINIASITTTESVYIDDLELSRWHSRFNLRISLNSGSTYDTVYYDLPYPYDVKQRYDSASNRDCSHLCNFYSKETRRFVFQVNRYFQSINIWHYGYCESPGFRNDLEFTTYFVRNNYVVKIVKGRIKTVLPTPRIVLEHKVANNPVNALLNYRIGLFLNNTYSRTHKYARFYIPDDFSEIQNCKIKFGFRVVDVTDINNKMKCRITNNYLFRGQNTTLVEFFNIYHYSTYFQHHYERIFIFQVTMRNPSTSRWTKEIHTEWFDNYDVTNDTYDQTQIQLETIDGCNTGRFWVGEDVPLANYFRVFRNRKSFIDRKQQINQWGELHLRIQPKNIIPKDKGVVEIQLPSDYDIADGGQKICQVGHDYHTDLDGQFCEITNERLIRVRTNQDKGLNQVCSLIRITTEQSFNNNNGFQAPPELSDQNFDLYLKDDTQVLEYTGSNYQPESYKFILNEDLFIQTSSNECSDYSVVKIKFDTKIRLYPGYDNDPKQTDIYLKQPITSFILYLNTYDQYNINIEGFPLDLGYTNYIIPCITIQNIHAKQGENLSCILEVQQSRNYYKPLKIIITNFEEIPINTNDIELHLLDIKWTKDQDNLGWVEFEIIQTKGDGTIQYLYEKQKINLYSQQSTGINYVSETQQNLMPIFSNNLVGQEMTLKLFFQISTTLIEQDTIVVEFPSSYIFPDQSKVNAIISYTIGSNNYFKTGYHYVYQSIQKMHFILPEFFAVQGCSVLNKCLVELKIQGIHNPAYAFNTPYSLKMRVIRNLKTLLKKSFDNIQPPLAAPFNFLKVKISSNSSQDINVTYNFEFIPSYNFPSESIIYINMDQIKYKHINESYPPVNCQTTFDDSVNYCKILPNQVVIKLSKQLSMNQSYTIELHGVKNPNYQGYTNINDMQLSVQHSNGFLINESYFNTLFYIQSKNVGTIYLNLNLSSYFNTIPSQYYFIIQNTFKVPKGGIIQIIMPQKWSQQIQGDLIIQQITGSFQFNKLIYTEQVVTQPNQSIIVQIFLQFEWPSQTRLNIYFKEIQNPEFISKTQPFQVQTLYDSMVIDRSDPEDEDTMIEYLKYEPKIQLLLADFYPKNEGEVAIYNFILTSELTIYKDTDIELIFSKDFEKFVAEPTKSLLCHSNTIQIDQCKFGDYKVIIKVLETIYSNQEFDFQISGVLNTNIEVSGFLSIATKVDNKLNQYTYALASYQTIIAPKRMQLVKIYSQNDQTLVKNDYEFCIYTEDQIIQQSIFMIEFPKQFKFQKQHYQCFISDDFDNDKLQYQYIDEKTKEVECVTYSHIRRIDIKGVNIVKYPSSNSKQNQVNRQCYKIKNMENSTKIGESFNFILKYYNPKTQLVYLKTFGHLDYPSNKHYQDNGLKIQVDEITPIKVGALSEEIQVTLEKQVSHDVQLKPISEGFTFIPELVDFKFNDSKTQNFRIKPDSNTKPGNYTIQFEKIEFGQNGQFSEIQEIQFQLTEALDSNKIQIELNQNVFRTAIGSESLPVKINLSQPSSEDLKIYINSVQPYQPDKVQIDPQFLEFKSGEIEKELTFKTLEGVLSGQLELSIDSDKEQYFTFQNKFINFEVMPQDNDTPQILDNIIQNIGPNSASFKTQMSESGQLFYLITKKNTPQPTKEEIINKDQRDKQYEILNEKFGNKFVEITQETSNYIYNNVYYDINNLEQNTEYTIYTVAKDLAGNFSEIKQFEFQTQKTSPPVQFQLKFNQVQSKEDILKALSVASGYSIDKFEIIQEPDLDYINQLSDGIDLTGTTFTYDIKINTNYEMQEDQEPFDLIQQLSEDKELLYELMPDLDTQFDYLMSTKELYAQSQNFTYVPFLQDVTTDQAFFNISVFETGNVYGIVQETNIPAPSSIQIQKGLNYLNNPILQGHKTQKKIVVDRNQYRIWPSQLLDFDYLYHSTNYIAYFIADIQFDGQIFLMSDENIQKIRFKTKREIFHIEESYHYVEKEF